MKGWRTILINVAALIGYLAAWPQLSEFLDPQYIALAHTAINIVLRFVTTTPVGGGEK